MKKSIGLIGHLTGLLIIAVLAACTRTRRETPVLEKMNVILIMVDTLAARHTSVYNPDLKSTPALAEFAKNALVFERAFSSAPWTKPSLASVYTSLFPSQHKANALYVPLDLRFYTLPERMQEGGFKTVGYVSHVMLSEKNGFTQGFDEYALMKFSGGVHDSITAHQVTDRALEWFDKNGTFANPDPEIPDSRFFMFLHYFDPHFAYQHHKAHDQTSWYKGDLKPGMNFRFLRDNAAKFSPDDLRYLVGLYHEEILYTDQQLGRLFEGLKARGIDKNTLIIFFADHGEEFMDHGGMGHSHTLYNELVHVPFIVSMPGVVKSARISEPVSTMDIWPTIEAFSKNPQIQKFWEGKSLKDTLINGSTPAARPIFSEVSWDAKLGDISAHKVAVVADEKKFIHDKRSKAEELFVLSDKLDETQNIVEQEAAAAEHMRKLIGEFIVNTAKPAMDFETGQTGENLHSPEEIEQLRSLGYL